MELKDVIKCRRSTRSFTDEMPTRAEICEMLEYAILAPSASNKQAWKFIIYDDKERKNSIVTGYGSAVIKNAPCGVLVLYRNDVSQNYRMYKDQYQSAAAAIQNFLLVATENGWGTCWVCDLLQPNILRKRLNIPIYYDIIAYIAIGKSKKYLSKETLSHYRDNSDDAINHKRKYLLKDIISFNEYTASDNTEEVEKYIWAKSFFFLIYKRIKNDKIRKMLWKIIKTK